LRKPVAGAAHKSGKYFCGTGAQKNAQENRGDKPQTETERL